MEGYQIEVEDLNFQERATWISFFLEPKSRWDDSLNFLP